MESIERRPAGYGPVCPVVWEGWCRKTPPCAPAKPDCGQWNKVAYFGARLAKMRWSVRRCMFEAARGLGDVAAAELVDALDVLPARNCRERGETRPRHSGGARCGSPPGSRP